DRGAVPALVVGRMLSFIEGKSMDAEDLEMFTAICQHHQFLVLTDEAHESIVFGGNRHQASG
ncbi:MAG: aminotransferase class I/II-fold pyridoxal phosphate-dependent enzyme, partial [Desulfobacterales bacterium]